LHKNPREASGPCVCITAARSPPTSFAFSLLSSSHPFHQSSDWCRTLVAADCPPTPLPVFGCRFFSRLVNCVLYPGMRFSVLLFHCPRLRTRIDPSPPPPNPTACALQVPQLLSLGTGAAAGLVQQLRARGRVAEPRPTLGGVGAGGADMGIGRPTHTANPPFQRHPPIPGEPVVKAGLFPVLRPRRHVCRNAIPRIQTTYEGVPLAKTGQCW